MSLKKLYDFRRRSFFEEDLDRFEEFLQEAIEEYDEYRSDGFPVGKPNYDRVNHRDLLIDD